MRVKFVWPRWERLSLQTPFILPPLGIAVAAALTPEGHEASFEDDNLAPAGLDDRPDLAAVGAMLACQLPRAFEIADVYRRRGVPVVLGGVAVTCVPDEAARHADAVVLGEAEGVWPSVVEDAARGALKPVYRREGFAGGAEIPSPRRQILPEGAYAYRGLRMMDLVETSRGCRFACLPCVVPSYSGKAFRPRPMAAVSAELASIANDRVYVVDNALDQDEGHERSLFSALKASGKRWVGHAVSATPELADLAAESGCWYVYQAVMRPSETFRDAVRVLRGRGIGVQATVLFGLDEHDADVFRRMADYLLECGVDLAEFTVLTPFPGTAFFDDMKAAGRILHEDWRLYNAEHAVFRPARMTPERLEEGCRQAWRLFYEGESQRARMARLYRRIMPSGTAGASPPGLAAEGR